MILLQSGSLANPTPNLPTEAVQPGQAQASRYLRAGSQALEVLSHGTAHTTCSGPFPSVICPFLMDRQLLIFSSLAK